MIDKVVSKATDLFAKMNKRERLLCMIAFASVLLCILDFGFLTPVVHKLGELDDEIQAQKDHIKRDYSMLAHEDRILDEAEQLRIYFESTYKDNDAVLSNLLRVIENLAIQK